MDIVKFLRARIAEDEAGVNTYGAAIAASSDHDQRRLIAECAAKRARIELHTVDHRYDDNVCYRCMIGCETEFGSPVAHYEEWPCIPLQLEAAPYKGHPDFDPAWGSWS